MRSRLDFPVALVALVALLSCKSPPSTSVSAPSSAASSSTSPDVGSCSERDSKASTELDEAMKKASNACDTDADCVVFPVGTICFDHCTQVVSNARANAGKTASDRINETTCATFLKDGCPRIPPPCAPSPPPQCVEHLCGGVK